MLHEDRRAKIEAPLALARHCDGPAYLPLAGSSTSVAPQSTTTAPVPDDVDIR